MSDILKRTWAEVNIDSVENNIKVVKSLIKPTCSVMAIVKADAYGHGAPMIAKALSKEGIDYFGVSNLDEALQLRHNDIAEPILILGYTPLENISELIKYNITQTVISLKYANELNNLVKDTGSVLKIHIKLDTGMSRLGLFCQGEESCLESVGEIKQIIKLNNLSAEGIFTHLSVSDDIKSSFTKSQFNNFMFVLDRLKNAGIEFKYRHCCNSAAIINFPEMHLDMVRPGIILYGMYPSKEMKITNIGLQQAMELKTVISQIKEFPTDVTVSYGRIYKTFKKTKVATLPIGYADGFLRILSNNAEVLVNGKRAVVIGRVCMDQMMIDVTGMEVEEGQTAVIIGHDGDDFISFDELADKMETINYETTCLIGKRVPRIYLKSGETIGNLKYIL